jgi:CHAT domain-containing protein
MAGFYKHWVSGAGHVTKAEALREAQLALLHGDSAHAHPFFWAPFILMGNWR